MQINNDDCVILDIKTYDTLSRSATKANLIVDRLFEMSEFYLDTESLLFNRKGELTELMHLVYPERYKNRIKMLSEESAVTEDKAKEEQQ